MSLIKNPNEQTKSEVILLLSLKQLPTMQSSPSIHANSDSYINTMPLSSGGRELETEGVNGRKSTPSITTTTMEAVTIAENDASKNVSPAMANLVATDDEDSTEETESEWDSEEEEESSDDDSDEGKDIRDHYHHFQRKNPCVSILDSHRLFSYVPDYSHTRHDYD
jgi:hypothetical protein